MAMLIAEQLSIHLFHQDDQVGNAVYYDCFTTRVEVACQAGVSYYSPDLLEDNATHLKMGNYDTLSDPDKKKVMDSVKQEYLAYLFLNNSNVNLHSQLKKDVANESSKRNTDAYPTNIHKALTQMNEYKPLKMDTPIIPMQGTAFMTGAKGNKTKGSTKAATGEYLKGTDWNALSKEKKAKVIEARKKSKANDNDNKSTSSNKSTKSLSKALKSLEKSNRKLKKSVSVLQKCNEDGNELSSTSEGTSHSFPEECGYAQVAQPQDSFSP
jgi:hypothetical protein